MRRRYDTIGTWIAGMALVALAVGCGSDDGAGDARDSGAPTADVGPDADTSQDWACTYFPDSCGERKNCYADVDEEGIERMCRRYNPDKSTGDSCQRTAACNSGDRCVDGACRTMCDPTDDDSCGSEAVCLPLSAGDYSLGFGICEPKGDRCTTWPNDDCGEGKKCYKLEQGNRCLSYNPDARAGDTCQGHQDCNAGQTCIDADGKSKAYCRNKCNDDHPCDSGKCRDLSGVSHGACIPPT